MLFSTIIAGQANRYINESVGKRNILCVQRYGCSMSVQFAAGLAGYFKGLNRTVAGQNHDSGEELTEENDHHPFSVLCSPCYSMMEHISGEFVFSHTFLFISWNLMCRSVAQATIHSGHIN
ncbi:hypothetical protein JG687_00012591 [Phytophthora cactorum]|uniref:Uncharacterized protein n=1 Tax=Phytophthora cactorum TaxID=29920 RepID=A0A8T1U6Q5_9STRA|nr:hypothetical protein JG687_00012591 [Phytophthora cactorum]